jgi:hypothetical protein
MPRKLTITLTCSNRADYLKEVIDTIRDADKTDIEILFLPSIDYKSQKVVDIISNVDFIEKDVYIHNPRLGCNQNTLFAINRGIRYDFSDYVLHLEDDTPISKDALQYFMYCFKKYDDDKNILSVGGYNKTEDFDESEIYEIFTQNFFSAWGCGFWKSKWDIFVKNWSKSNSNFDMSWDSYIHEVLFVKELFHQARPKISRIQNIGALNGTWVQDPVWHYYNHRSPYLSNDFEGNIDWIQYAKNNQ